MRMSEAKHRLEQRYRGGEIKIKYRRLARADKDVRVIVVEQGFITIRDYLRAHYIEESSVCHAYTCKHFEAGPGRCKKPTRYKIDEAETSAVFLHPWWEDEGLLVVKVDLCTDGFFRELVKTWSEGPLLVDSDLE